MTKKMKDSHRKEEPRKAAKPLALTDVQVEAVGRETGEPGWMVDSRRSALEAYRRMEMPSAADEAWRWSDLLQYPFSDLTLEALTVSGKPKRAPAAWLKPAAGGGTGGWIALEDGAVKTALLDEDLLQAGVVFLPILQAAREHPDLVQPLLSSIVPAADGVFSALTSILFDSGIFLHVPKGVRVEKPLHSLLWSSGDGLRAWRLLVDVAEGAEVSLLHECASPEKKPGAARLDIVELNVHPDATLRFFLTQHWGGNVVRIAHERAVVHRKGRLVWGSAHVGAQSSKTFSGLDLKEEGASAQWTALHVLGGTQQAEYYTLQNHAAPNTGSDYLLKGVLSGSAHLLSEGMVRVAPGAAGADGYQGNRILILSDRAKAEAIPGLEILSDDVRCSHGVSIGELDPEELFYLRSRGISEEESRRVLVGGFLETALGRIPEENIRRRVHLAVGAKIETMEEGIDRDENTAPEDRRENEQGVSA
jgi:Fe-S cluster assembly protein SufD